MITSLRLRNLLISALLATALVAFVACGNDTETVENTGANRILIARQALTRQPPLSRKCQTSRKRPNSLSLLSIEMVPRFHSPSSKATNPWFSFSTGLTGDRPAHGN